MLKIGQNWGKIANYPPNAQQRSAPLLTAITDVTKGDAGGIFPPPRCGPPVATYL